MVYAPLKAGETIAKQLDRPSNTLGTFRGVFRTFRFTFHLELMLFGAVRSAEVPPLIAATAVNAVLVPAATAAGTTAANSVAPPAACHLPPLTLTDCMREASLEIPTPILRASQLMLPSVFSDILR